MRKIDRFKKKKLNTEGLERELAYASGEKKREDFATGQGADPRLKKRVYNTHQPKRVEDED